MKLTKITPCLKDQPFLTLKRMMYAATSTPMLCTRSPRACTNAALTARLLCPWPLLRAALGEFDWGTWEWRWEWEWEWRCPDWFSKKPILKLEREKCTKKWAWELCGCFFVTLFYFFNSKQNEGGIISCLILWGGRGAAKPRPMRKLQAINELRAYSEIYLWASMERKGDLTLS